MSIDKNSLIKKIRKYKMCEECHKELNGENFEYVRRGNRDIFYCNDCIAKKLKAR
jgi:hypothetical protein